MGPILADAPARSLLKYCKPHGAYFGCMNCEIKGRGVKNYIYKIKIEHCPIILNFARNLTPPISSLSTYTLSTLCTPDRRILQQ